MKEDLILAVKTILLPLLALTFLFMLYSQVTAKPPVYENLKQTVAQLKADHEKAMAAISSNKEIEPCKTKACTDARYKEQERLEATRKSPAGVMAGK